VKAKQMEMEEETINMDEEEFSYFESITGKWLIVISRLLK